MLGRVEQDAPSLGGGDRARAARLAAAAALRTGGVAGLTGGRGGVWATPVPEGAVPGVLATAGADGTLDVAVHVVARPVALLALADAVRDGVAEAIGGAGLATPLGRVDVVIADLLIDPMMSQEATT